MASPRFVTGENPTAPSKRETRWLTPKWLVEALGDFDLDPAGAPGWDLADETYTLENGQDGLVLPWRGRIWLNPPYGAQAKPFMKRMADHNHGTALLFARTETQMFQRQVFGYATAALFLEGRVSFLREDGAQSGVAAAPSLLLAYGEGDALALRTANIKGHFLWLDSAKRTGEERLA